MIQSHTQRRGFIKGTQTKFYIICCSFYLEFLILLSSMGRIHKYLSMSSLKDHFLWEEWQIFPRRSLSFKPVCPQEPFASFRWIIISAYSRHAGIWLLACMSVLPTKLPLNEEVWHQFKNSAHLAKSLAHNRCSIKIYQYLHIQRRKKAVLKCMYTCNFML